ncbi:ribosome recycling factor [Candidatus Adlerbacteria bacterium RIFCSPHIGHO2_02_FULL_54_18]|uniref:Ribosome recycling factor n=2 Tax=Candidatus Adleribacteriota TaxID=1752736 RepID=A0A1F4Y2B6_9BACT|nr:MAG: ribosome recycling factor [Candidatus Adlerbacteria bacterium RIFCSPLOWO2_01_FULL_54_21b]OGC87926.1 MAG: ribosome recycling factor [Candidatus Adlerbacteria bacterium RIFCSPHIGHO2_02_FULL_54_18]
MVYDFKPFDKRLKEIGERAGKEMSGIRTGRAAPAILDGIMVESYGTRAPITQVAAVSVEDARTIRIIPWDMQNGKEIEKAIAQANLGLSVGLDERGVRVAFPELTSERRGQLVKLAKEKIEEVRTMLRTARDDVWSDIQRQEKDKKISEDEKFRYKEEMQKRVDAANKNFDAALERKEKEIAN